MNMDGSGCIDFEDLWGWFLPLARRKHSSLQRKGNKKKGFVFDSALVFSARDRAVITLLRRFEENEAKNFIDFRFVCDRCFASSGWLVLD